MSYDGYRSPPPPRAEQPYPFDHVDARAQYPNAYPPPYPPDHLNGRPRAPSSARPESFSPAPIPDSSRYAPAKPINEAVTSAFTRADDSGYKYPPELVSQMSAQITEDVINRLRASGLDGGGGSEPPSLARSSSNSACHSHSNSISPPLPSGARYSPPSPRQKPDFPKYGSPPAPAVPGPPPGPFPRSPREQPAARLSERRGRSPEADANESPSRSRPRKPQVSVEPNAVDAEETPLDRKWGHLFEDGKATDRLGQYFRGLANYIIKDFEPANSIVVTPYKMARYYELAKLDDETHPWNVLFKVFTSARLGRLYQELECQHHLVQERLYDERPAIPGLTPVGFQRWMTLLMLSDPNREVERLQKTVLEMPISNADDHTERFPKEVSRRLFPVEEDWRMRSRIDKAFSVDKQDDEVRYDPTRPTARPDPSRNIPKPDPPRVEPPTNPVPPLSSSVSNLERERTPYSNASSECAIDELPLPPPPPPPTKIERERQPYRVQPGLGKTYDNDTKTFAHRERAHSASKPPPQAAQARPSSEALPDVFPEAPGHHRAASTSVHPVPRGRRRSPSISSKAPPGDFRRSDNDILGNREPSAPINIPNNEAGGRRYPPRRGPEDDGMQGFESPRERERYERMPDIGTGPRRGYEEDYYRPDGGRGGVPPGYDYHQQYPAGHR
ncbi:MAG: hypothetical protein M1837_006919 [Sclerophora amabilis]|nr:MAG: hypothetical protein M1837_006919 [Sclerophora amabilis]